jgi:hypothetical protein
MKVEKLFIPAILLLSGYVIYSEYKKTQGEIGGALGNLGQGLQGLLNTPAQIIREITEAPAQLLTSQPAVQAGGGALNLVNSLLGTYSNQSVGSQAILANVDYINTVSGANIISANIQPTALGTILQLRGGEGVPLTQSQAYIDLAVNAARASGVPTYGVSLKSGGINSFNLPDVKITEARAPTVQVGGGGNAVAGVTKIYESAAPTALGSSVSVGTFGGISVAQKTAIAVSYANLTKLKTLGLIK